LDLRGWTIAFDLDGTLVETAPDLVGALNQVMAEQGLAPLPFETVKAMVGRGVKVLIERGYAATGVPLSEDVAPALFERFIEIYRGRIALQSAPFEGCLEVLEALSEAGAILTVATNKRTDLSLALLDALGMTRRFAAVVGADRAPAAKPDGRHIRFAIEAAGGDPDRAIMVGDSATDIDGAKNAGVPVIAFTFGYTDVHVSELGADVVLDSYAQMIGAVEGLVGARV